MASVAELVLRIGANNAGLKKTLNDSQMDIKKAFATNPIDSLTGALTGATGGLSSFVSKVSALSALAAGGFGLSSLISGAVAGGESVYQLSTKLGITAAEASQLNKVLKLTGGDAASFASAMTRLDKSYMSNGSAGEKTKSVLDAFGVSLVDSEGKLLPLNQQLAALSKGYKLAAANGTEQEFIMDTLGVKGLSLVQTLKDYDEASTNASKTKGVGIDPKQMHELDQQMKIVSMQAGSLGTAFTGALAPIAQELFPPIMSGLSSVATLLAQNKGVIGSTVVTLVELTAAYKTLGAVSTIITGISNAWNIASAQAIAASTTSTAVQMASATELTAWQQKSIAQQVAASNKGYAKMAADAQKAAVAMGLSAQETATIIAEKCVQIATAGAEAATSLRTTMTASYLAQNAAAIESAAVQTAAINEVAVAAGVASGKVVAANEVSAGSANLIVAANERVAASHVIAGNAAVVAGETTVGAMAVARTAVGGLIKSVFTLIGGWAGVAVAIGYAIYKLGEYQTADREWRGKEALSNEPYAPEKGSISGMGDFNKDDDGKKVDKWIKDHPSKPVVPEIVIPEITVPGGNSGGGSSGGKSAVDETAKAWEDLQKKTEQVTQSIEKEWVQTTKTQLEQLDIWNKEQNDSLDEIKTEYESSGQVFAEYETDKARIAAVYSSRRTKIVQQESKDAIDTFKSIRDGYESIQRGMSGLTGSAKGVDDINVNYDDKIKSAKDYFDKITQDYEVATDAQKKNIIDSLNKEKVAYQISADGKLNLDKATADASAAYQKQKLTDLTNYYATCKDIQANIDAAYQANSMAKLQETLTAENAIRQSNYDAQIEMMKLYQQASSDATLTWAEIVSRTSSTAYDGFKNGLADIFSGVTSISDAWTALGGVVRNVIAKMVAEWVAGKIAMALFGKSSGDETTAKSVTQGAATAAAWWPAAIAVSLATFGANSGPAIGGMAAATIAGMAMGTISGKATGGAINGPGTGTSDSILSWLSNGEYVIKASAAKALGIDALNTLNTGKMPAYATGGLVTGASLSSVGSSRYVNASLAGNKSISDTNKSTTASSAGDQYHFSISGIDGPSIRKMILSEGATIVKSLKNQAKGFNTAGVSVT